MALIKTTKDVVGAGLILGAGGLAFGAMGQGAIATQTVGRAGGMLGAVVPAIFGMEVLNIVDKGSKKL